MWLSSAEGCIVGLKIKVNQTPPQPGYKPVINHTSWLNSFNDWGLWFCGKRVNRVLFVREYEFERVHEK